MSERLNCKHLPTDKLWDMVDHAQAEIERWEEWRQMIIGQLACRGEIED